MVIEEVTATLNGLQLKPMEAGEQKPCITPSRSDTFYPTQGPPRESTANLVSIIMLDDSLLPVFIVLFKRRPAGC